MQVRGAFGLRCGPRQAAERPQEAQNPQHRCRLGACGTRRRPNQCDAEFMTYDEARYLKRVSEMSRRNRVAWAAAAAELLLPTSNRIPDAVAPESVDSMRSELDHVWASLDDPEAIPLGPSKAEALVPDEDQIGWTPGHGLLQNIAASVAYATRCADSGEAQQAIWAWRQVYEIVDLVNEAREDAEDFDLSGLPDVAVIIVEYLNVLEAQSPEVLRTMVQTRAEPLSAALARD